MRLPFDGSLREAFSRRLALVCALLVASIVYGGAARQGYWADSLPQFLAILVLPFLDVSFLRRSGLKQTFAIFLGVLLAIPLFQLIPIPPELWRALPPHSETVKAYQMIGVFDDWRPIALRATEAWRAFFSLLPPVVLALAVLALDERERLILLLVLVGMAAFSILIALIQLILGSSSPMWFFNLTFTGQAKGFFANRNLFASLTFMVLPLAVALSQEIGRRSSSEMARTYLVMASLFVFLIGLSASGSRSALLLGGLIVVSTFLFVMRFEDLLGYGRRGSAIVFLLIGAVLLPVLLGVGLDYILGRLEDQGVTDETRFMMLKRGLALLPEAFPFGIGFGSFDRFYGMREPDQELMITFVNHLHNDWVQILLEGGLLSVAAILFGLALLFTIAKRIQKASRQRSTRLEVALMIGLIAVIIHGLWDFPLRTIAIASVSAVMMASLIAMLSGQGDEATGRRTRRTT